MEMTVQQYHKMNRKEMEETLNLYLKIKSMIKDTMMKKMMTKLIQNMKRMMMKMKNYMVSF